MATDIEAGMVDYLLAQATITNLVGQKIEPFKTNQKIASPYIVYLLRSKNAKQCLSGSSGLEKCHYQLDVYAETEAQVNAIIDALRDLFADGYRGSMGSVTVPYAYIDDIMHVIELNYGAADVWPFHKALILCINYYT